VEFDGHSIGTFREHLKEALVNELVDLGWHGVALADLAHWSVSRPGEKPSVSNGGWKNGVWNYTLRCPPGASATDSIVNFSAGIGRKPPAVILTVAGQCAKWH